MKITALSHRKKGLTAVTFEDGSEFLIDSELISKKGLMVQSEVEDLDKLLYESDFKRAKSRALWYLSRRDHSKKELYDKLVSGGFSDRAAVDSVERMVELGLVDDLAYAKRLYEQLVGCNCASNREAAAKLKLKGIHPDIIKEILEDKMTDECENIRRLIKRKYAKRLDTEEGVKKTFAALIRKGFSFSDVRKALEEYSLELDCEEF